MHDLLIIWIVIAVVALAIDIATSNFFFVSFTFGSVAALIANLLNASQAVQIILFIVISVICLAVGYPLVKKTLKKTVDKTPTLEESYIGRQFKLGRDVEEKASIKFDGIYWTVKSEETALKRGELVEIVGIEGNKLLIKRVEG
jgi:membrane protein implicated in regulation of membrane protease activity